MKSDLEKNIWYLNDSGRNTYKGVWGNASRTLRGHLKKSKEMMDLEKLNFTALGLPLSLKIQKQQLDWPAEVSVDLLIKTYYEKEH